MASAPLSRRFRACRRTPARGRLDRLGLRLLPQHAEVVPHGVEARDLGVAAIPDEVQEGLDMGAVAVRGPWIPYGVQKARAFKYQFAAHGLPIFRASSCSFCSRIMSAAAEM